MLFNSINFLIFFPIVLIIYFIFPERYKYLWLLAASYYFYMCWNVKYILLIFTSTLITYFSGLWLEKVKKSHSNHIERKKRGIVATSFILNLGILFYFKYANFFIDIITRIFSKINITIQFPIIDVVLPVGISFYIFQALSYTMDVYRDEIYAEKNFFRYALFVSFFPQLVAGPIERSKNLLKQLSVPKKFNYELAKKGFLLMLWGYFLKIVLADRISIFVDTIYGDYTTYTGWYLILATILFSVQIYCDFAGYSTIAIGTAKILGIELMENFDAPYLSTSVGEFWRKWHISLTSWFKDYLYIPLGGSRHGKLRKYMNKMIVFLVSGLWHGAKFSFVAWGGLNGIYQIVEELLQKVVTKLYTFLHIKRDSLIIRSTGIIITFILIDFSWIFFRAQHFLEGVQIVKSIMNASNIKILVDGSIYHCGLDSKNFYLMLLCILILVFADYCKHRRFSISDFILQQNYWFRCLFISISIVLILTFGIWGPSFSESNFIYFQF